uniref:Uncharacterized protein n=1 Tax=Zooxanthella nutricula TaxID=1333877 RepID=A0A7S2VSP8_9DINO
MEKEERCPRHSARYGRDSDLADHKDDDTPFQLLPGPDGLLPFEALGPDDPPPQGFGVDGLPLVWQGVGFFKVLVQIDHGDLLPLFQFAMDRFLLSRGDPQGLATGSLLVHLLGVGGARHGIWTFSQAVAKPEEEWRTEHWVRHRGNKVLLRSLGFKEESFERWCAKLPQSLRATMRADLVFVFVTDDDDANIVKHLTDVMHPQQIKVAIKLLAP